jgi:hypothetical protein
MGSTKKVLRFERYLAHWKNFTNPATGKGWTGSDEQAFADIMAVSRLTRIEAVQLWKRCQGDATKAVRTARQSYPKPSTAILGRLAKARAARLKGVSIEINAPGREIAPGKPSDMKYAPVR